MRSCFWLVLGIALGVGGFLFGQTMVLAATDDFTIRTYVGDDTNPPTTPVLTSVVPVTETQINITWTAAVDDVFLIGYRLFRNGVQIATTTQTSFSDGGLVPSTLYVYTVDAFDSFTNISSTSLPLSTTTLSVPTVPTTTPPNTTQTSASTRTTSLIDTVSVIPSLRSAVFTWQTTTNSRYTIVWGRTTSYELGSISTNIFKQSHETTLENLEPGTRYWYSLSATDTRGVTKVLKQGEFVTIAAFAATTLPNVRNVAVAVSGNDVSLSWINPVLPEGAVVRVVRSHLFYPQSLTDGALVYEGEGTNVRDLGILAQRSPQYYTIFIIDKDGAVSSGAVAAAYGVEWTSPPPLSEDTVSLPAPVLEAGDPRVLKAESVFIRQGSETQVLATDVVLEAERTYTIFIPRSAVAPNLKSIIVTIQDPTDQRTATTYLLKLNQAGDAYEAVIAPPRVVGESRITIEVFDFTQASVRLISTRLNFVSAAAPARVFPDTLIAYGPVYLVGGGICFGVFLLGWWLVLLRRR